MSNPGRAGAPAQPSHKHVWRLSRRKAISSVIALGLGLPFALSLRRSRAADCQPTGTVPIEGPYFFGEPEARASTGSGVVIRGVVWDADTCTPIPGATIVRWHSDPSGVYEDYYRARMVTDERGGYEMATIVPGIYAGLARHVHFHVSAEGYGDAITQIQWDNARAPDPENEFNFVLRRA